MNEDLTMTIAAALKAARKEQGLTMEQLGERAGMTRGSVCRLEKGEWSPTLRSLQPVLDALGYTIEIKRDA